nr:MAG TPA: hypothetical protein [Caudoviricetes sp.]
MGSSNKINYINISTELPRYLPLKREKSLKFKSVFYSTTDKVIPTLSIPRALRSTSFFIASQSILNLISRKSSERRTKALKVNLS